jgi:hypothetical protein
LPPAPAFRSSASVACPSPAGQFHIVVFGSPARGEAGPDSDPDDIARRGETPGDVLRSALREGRAVYESPADLARLGLWPVESRYPGEWPETTTPTRASGGA